MPGPKPTPPYERVMARAHRSGNCLVVTPASHPDGYATVGFGRKHLYAHRVVWAHHHGPIPKGVVIRHTCDNPPCVEVTHLTDGSLLDNNIDMWVRERSSRSPYKTECIHGHAYTPENTVVDRKTGWRSCRECRKEVMKRRRNPTYVVSGTAPR